MRWEVYDPGRPRPGEALLRHEAVGLNYIDVYNRTGLYPLPSLPAIPGMEGAGIVEAIGEGVSEVAIGDRVAYAGLPSIQTICLRLGRNRGEFFRLVI